MSQHEEGPGCLGDPTHLIDRYLDGTLADDQCRFLEGALQGDETLRRQLSEALTMRALVDVALAQSESQEACITQRDHASRYLAGRLPPEHTGPFTRHLRDCAECRGWFEGYQASRQKVRTRSNLVWALTALAGIAAVGLTRAEDPTPSDGDAPRWNAAAHLRVRLPGQVAEREGILSALARSARSSPEHAITHVASLKAKWPETFEILRQDSTAILQEAQVIDPGLSPRHREAIVFVLSLMADEELSSEERSRGFWVLKAFLDPRELRGLAAALLRTAPETPQMVEQCAAVLCHEVVSEEHDDLWPVYEAAHRCRPSAANWIFRALTESAPSPDGYAILEAIARDDAFGDADRLNSARWAMAIARDHDDQAVLQRWMNAGEDDPDPVVRAIAHEAREVLQTPRQPPR